MATKTKVTTSKKFIKPSFSSLIEKKRDSGEFSDEEMRYVVDSILDKEIPEYQLAALVMAIYFQGMSAQETAVFTEEMMISGEVVDLSSISIPKVDRYCVGGVGDKSTLILAALAASCGVVVPCMVNSREEFVISTQDKLSAIPGFKAKSSIKEFVSQLKKIHCAIYEQAPEVTPVDTILNTLRQETATIPSLPLITGSILSKKLAEGAESLVVDVKWGNGSVIKELEQAKQLARSITRVARSMNRRCVALVTDMNQPIGDSVGTGLEVKEALLVLQGKGPEDLNELVLKMGMEMIRLAGVAGSTLSAKQTILRHIKDGSALEKFKQMICAQGGNTDFIDDPELLPKAAYCRKLPAPKRGYVHTINAGMLARGVHILALNKDGSLDPSAGITEIKKVGIQVKQGESLMMIHYNDESRLEAALELLKNAYRLAPKRPTPLKLIVERVA